MRNLEADRSFLARATATPFLRGPIPLFTPIHYNYHKTIPHRRQFLLKAGAPSALHYRNGILLAPITAERLAAQIVNGCGTRRTPKDPLLQPFLPDRFSAETILCP